MDPGPYGCLGAGLDQAISAKIARPLCLLLGDGAFGFSGLEFDGTIDTPMVADMLETQAGAMKEIMRDQPIGRLARSGNRRRRPVALQRGGELRVGVALPVDGGFTAH
jgi:hypothetical protein